MNKKGLIAVLFVLMLAPSAWAFTVPADVEVSSAPQDISIVSSSSATTADLERTRKAIKKETDWLSVRQNKTRRIIKAQGKELGGKIDALTGKDGAITKLSEDNKASFKDQKNNIWSAGKEMVSSVNASLMILGGVILLALSIFFLFVYRGISGVKDEVEKKVKGETKSDNSTTLALEGITKILSKLQEVPKETAALVKALDPCTVKIKDVRGKVVEFTPEIVDGMYLSLYVPKTVSKSVANPEDIVRVPMSKGRLYRSTLDIVADYIDGQFDGKDEHSLQQKMLIEHLINTKKNLVIG